MSQKKIVVITPFRDDDWKWFSREMGHYAWDINNLDLYAKKAWLWVVNVVPLLRKIADADLIVSHHPQMSLSIAICMRFFGMKTPHLACSFNHGNGRFFRGIHNLLAKWAFKNVWGFVVFSEEEKKIYSNFYRQEINKFSFTHWAVNDPETDGSWWHQQNFPKQYICSLGRNNRDWRLFLEVAGSIPYPAVVVCNKSDLFGLIVPNNVTVLHDLTAEQCASVVAGSLLNVVPILDDSRGTGHITVVNSMKLGVPLVIANNATLRDYFIDGQHGYVYSVGSAVSLKKSILMVLEGDVQHSTLSRQCKEFASRWFAESSAKTSLEAVLSSALRGDSLPPASPIDWAKVQKLK
jgi:glycosyltransferase involved in cell wall biosynthesis